MARRIVRLLWRTTIQTFAIIGAVVCVKCLIDKSFRNKNCEDFDVDYLDDDWDIDLDPDLDD